MDKSRPLALCHTSKQHIPRNGGRTVALSPALLQSPEQVSAYAVWWVRQNWHLAECRKVLSGETP